MDLSALGSALMSRFICMTWSESPYFGIANARSVVATDDPLADLSPRLRVKMRTLTEGQPGGSIPSTRPAHDGAERF
jgi:hypothetical protein